MTSTQTTSRRDNLKQVYIQVVEDFAADAQDLATETRLSVDIIRQLLNSLARKGLVVGEKVNGEGPLVWQAYHNIHDEEGALGAAHADFERAFPIGTGEAPNANNGTTRNAPGENEVVYEVKKTRTTGAHVVLIHKPNYADASKWAMLCVTHKRVQEISRRMDGEALAHHSHVWCEDCQVIAEERQA